MSQQDFVWIQIYKGALKAGSSERYAKDQAQVGLDEYKKNKFDRKVSHLIEKRIKNAVVLTKKDK